MKKLSFWWVCVIIASLMVGPAWAAPVQWTGPGANNHWYLAVYVPGGLTWNAAKEAAEAMGGYLACAVSAEENNFIFSLINDWKFWYNDPWNSLGPWLGGYYIGPPGTMNPNDWAWLSGEPWDFKNWAPGEPNYDTETVLQFFGSGWNNMQPTWNNLSGDNPGPKGYVVEWNAKPPAAWVPTSLLLLE